MSAVPSSPGTVVAEPPPLPASDGSMLARAAHALVREGRPPEALPERALRHYAEGLRQYLVVRVGDPERGAALFERLQREIAELRVDALQAAPGLRARLYAHARRLVQGLRPETGRLPWRAPRRFDATALAALRGGLSDADAELLELRHARELRPAELAFVLSRDIGDVLADLERATATAAALLACDEGAGLRPRLVEAFALDQPSLARSRTADVSSRDGTLIESDDALAPGTCLGARYVLQARVGTGAFGDVYRAEDREVPGHVVALKLLHQPSRDPAARDAALRELKHIASVFHPAVVQFKDHGWHDERLWFVMPWYDGETLQSRLERTPLSRADARTIFEPIARGLAAMHAAGLRHQDVKPDNIFLAELGDGTLLPVLIDLGVSTTAAEMLVAGTPTYFAPEVAAQFCPTSPKPKVTVEADVFSLALALRNALEPDTEEDVPAGAVEAFVERRAIARPPLPTRKDLRFLRKDFARWMSLDPYERPTADDFALELARLTAPEERRDRRRATLRWLVPLLVTLVALASAGVGAMHTRAAERRLEAERARAEAAAVQADLVAERDASERLSERAERVSTALATSRETGAALASQLATARAARHTADEQVRRLRGERDAVSEALASQEAALAAAR
ncbi:MAG: serine/threonine-protein kinase, partial [Myxococcota bacterium]